MVTISLNAGYAPRFRGSEHELFDASPPHETAFRNSIQLTSQREMSCQMALPPSRALLIAKITGFRSRARARVMVRKLPLYLAALRCDRIEAPWVLDGPINGESFRTYVGSGPNAEAGRRRHPR